MKFFQHFMILTFGILFLFGCSNKQKYFEGVIEYAYTYQSDSLNLITLKAERPSSGQMIYKDSMYKSVFIGKNPKTYIYNNNTGIAYFLSNSDSIDCEDYKVPNDAIFKWEIIDTDEKILGEAVKILEFTSTNSTNRYYYSLTHKVAPYNYDKHIAYNWKFHKEFTGGGILLKVEHQFKNFTITGTATRIEVKEIPDQEFAIDKNKLKVKCR